MHAPLGSWLTIKTDFLMMRCICLSPVSSRYLQGTVFLQLQKTADENMHQKKQSRSTGSRLLSLISIIVLISTSQTLASQISEQLCQVQWWRWQPRSLEAFGFAHCACTSFAWGWDKKGRSPCHIMPVIDGDTDCISFASSRDRDSAGARYQGTLLQKAPTPNCTTTVWGSGFLPFAKPNWSKATAMFVAFLLALLLVMPHCYR